MVRNLRVTKKMASQETTAREAPHHPRNVTSRLYEDEFRSSHYLVR